MTSGSLESASGVRQLFSASHSSTPYKDGPTGVIQEGAYADIILIDGNPLKNIEVMTDPDKNIHVIMKDGVIYKNTLTE